MDDENIPATGGASWLAKADDDLRVARVILGGDIGGEWAACFHAQQAAEKALKGVLVHLGIDFEADGTVTGWCSGTDVPGTDFGTALEGTVDVDEATCTGTITVTWGEEALLTDDAYDCIGS